VASDGRPSALVRVSSMRKSATEMVPAPKSPRISPWLPMRWMVRVTWRVKPVTFIVAETPLAKCSITDW